MIGGTRTNSGIWTVDFKEFLILVYWVLTLYFLWAHLFYFFLSCPVLSCPVLSCRVLSCLVQFSPVLHSSSLFDSFLSCSHTTSSSFYLPTLLSLMQFASIFYFLFFSFLLYCSSIFLSPSLSAGSGEKKSQQEELQMRRCVIIFSSTAILCFF